MGSHQEGKQFVYELVYNYRIDCFSCYSDDEIFIQNSKRWVSHQSTIHYVTFDTAGET